ncbi:MAG TPA: HU family DNA-binding protein [Solirubrobacterales bacterium]|jgi:DNA-binding protein HU-beta|nr:HU family DNA-binding protein [Solirubrobacterales bacterium]
MAIVNKDQLAKSVAERTGLNNSQAKLALEATLEEIAARLGGGDEVRLTGFGKFSVSQRAAREGRNPQTGATMQIPAKRVPKFGAGAELKNAVE